MKIKSGFTSSRFFYIVLTLFTLFLISRTSFGRPLRSLTLRLSQPFFAPVYSLGSTIHSFFSDSTDLATLRSENETLQQEVIELKISNTKLQTAADENLVLRSLLDFNEDATIENAKVFAQIVSRDPETPAILLLNQGEREGVHIGNAVVVQDGVMVGKITEVYARTSKALLLTDSASSVAVTVSGGTPSSKIARGERGLSLILDQVPTGEILTQGQLVITSGLESAIPKGLIVGEIEEVISEPNDLFQTAVLRPLVDYSQMVYVSIVLSSGPL